MWKLTQHAFSATGSRDNEIGSSQLRRHTNSDYSNAGQFSNSDFASILMLQRERRRMRHKLQTDFCSTASTSLLLLALSCCAAAADAARGEIIAKRWCAACHLVSADQKQAVADVPSFGGIARMRLPAASLKAFLADPHPKMPDMSLSRSEIEDLVAYIKSLDK